MSPLLLTDRQARPVLGFFRLRVLRAGRRIEDMAEPNLVVTGAATILALLLGGSVAGNSVTQIGFGTNLTAAAAGNTALTGAYDKAVDSVSWPVAGSVQFNFSLASAEANGMAIGEFGLLTPGGTLIARKVRSAALNKDTDISLSGSWTITF